MTFFVQNSQIPWTPGNSRWCVPRVKKVKLGAYVMQRLAVGPISESWDLGAGKDCSLGLGNGTGARSGSVSSSPSPGTRLQLSALHHMEVKELGEFSS